MSDRAWRGFAALLALLSLLDHRATHEYLHCVLYWSRGGGDCGVTYYRDLALAHVAGAPWWEHFAVYGLTIGAPVLIVVIAAWPTLRVLARDVRVSLGGGP